MMYENSKRRDIIVVLLIELFYFYIRGRDRWVQHFCTRARFIEIFQIQTLTNYTLNEVFLFVFGD
jgi:hypothetical protein